MALQATLTILPHLSTICADEVLPVRIVLDATDAVNAVQGTLTYDPTALSIESVSTGGSVFQFWPVRPTVNTERGTITFAGGLPNPGYSGKDATLVTLYVKPLRSDGITKLSWSRETAVLLNDGKGTHASTSLVNATLTASPESSSVCEGVRSIPAIAADTTAPEPFSVVIARSDEAFQGKYFASYNAYDADSGVVRYEVRENGDMWYQAWSPYVLQTQSGEVLVEVKAVDAFGNQRIASTSAMLKAGDGFTFGPWWFWLIALIGIGLAIWRMFSKRKKRESVNHQDENPNVSVPRVVYDRNNPTE